MNEWSTTTATVTTGSTTASTTTLLWLLLPFRCRHHRLSETWLTTCAMITIYFRIDTAFVGLTGVLTAILSSVGSCSRKHDLELCTECVCVEIPTADGIKHYFSPDTKPKLLVTIFAFLKTFWTPTIFALFPYGTTVLLVITGRAGHLCLTATIIPNPRRYYIHVRKSSRP
jgi:hypothetical protein